MISSATHSKPLERRENKRVYNLVENLCMAHGMTMPKVNVIEDSSLNAFASGINKKSYTVTLTRGIIDRLNDAELEGVIAHELCHIRNRDVRLLIFSIIFVGIFTFIAQAAMRSLWLAPGRSRSSNNNGKGAIVIVLIAVALAAIGYLVSLLLRFAISRKREFMADAGAAQMTQNPHALAMALRKISGDPTIASVKREDIAQLFIEHPLSKKGGFSSLFATHPPIHKRIEILEQF
jgi:heat shock protein HtpX